MAFNLLPIELNAEIAKHLRTDEAICNLRLVCQATRYAIDCDKLGFWRDRFVKEFDPPNRPTSARELKKVYQVRKRILRGNIRFRDGRDPDEKECLAVLQGLITESSFRQSTCRFRTGRVSLNLWHIESFIAKTNLLCDTLLPTKQNDHPLYIAVQLVLSYHSLKFSEPRGGNPSFTAWGFPMSQKQVYECAKDAPIFDDKHNVNLNWLLHCFNFFKYHFTRKEEHTLFHAFRDMGKQGRPQAWNRPLEEGSQELGRFWKGTYAYIERHEMRKMRKHPAGTHYIQDKNVDNGEQAFQMLELNFPAPTEQLTWPRLFESILHSSRKPLRPRTRAQRSGGATSVGEPTLFRFDTIHFDGGGYDDEIYHSCGWLNPLPPQQGIPGWQRMTMMKYFIDDHGHLDRDALWAYEGVVLPGGQIMLGRWWCPSEDAQSSKTLYSGPFIFWDVHMSATPLVDEAAATSWRTEREVAAAALSAL